MDREKLMQLQIIEQEAQQLNQQMEYLEQNIVEIQELKNSLEEMGKKENEEMLVNIGKKIFVPVKITDKTLVVEVGNKNFVKKSIPETISLVEEQVVKIMEAKGTIMQRLQEIEKDMDSIIRDFNDQVRSSPSGEGHSHEHNQGHGHEHGHSHNGHECECGEHGCENKEDDCECGNDEECCKKVGKGDHDCKCGHEHGHRH